MHSLVVSCIAWCILWYLAKVAKRSLGLWQKLKIAMCMFPQLFLCISSGVCMCVYFIFNWRIITLQYCVGFCHTTRISHKCMYACMQSHFSHVQFFVTNRFLYPWDSPGKNTELSCYSPPGDLPDPGIEPVSSALQAEWNVYFWATGEAYVNVCICTYPLPLKSPSYLTLIPLL